MAIQSKTLVIMNKLLTDAAGHRIDVDQTGKEIAEAHHTLVEYLSELRQGDMQ